MPTEKKSFRMDFIQELTGFDDKTGKFQIVLYPNPERYTLKKVNNEDGFFDKFDNVFISTKLLKTMLQKKKMSIHYSPPKIESVDRYVLLRTEEIKKSFGSKDGSFELKDLSEEFLHNLEKDKQRFVILSIDLRGSTKMSQQLSPEQNSEVISLYLKEMTLIVDKFHGYILKYIGDGLIAYFPEPNFAGMNDNALGCALAMKKMILQGINCFLKEKELPILGFRIGLDSGEAIIKTLGAETIKMHKDLIGETVNLAAKIQSLAKDGQVLLGESTALNVHTFWRQKIKKLEPAPVAWAYKDKQSGQNYPLYYLED